jgi:TatD DNase family protein
VHATEGNARRIVARLLGQGLMNGFIDTHAHLDYPDFAADLPQVIDRAQAAGVSTIITVGTDLESSARAIKLSEQYAQLYAAVGWHPSDAGQAPEDLRPALRALASHRKVVAIGETGLDFYRLPSRQAGGTVQDDERYLEQQRRIFAQQLEIASELGLNCIIHQRQSFPEVMELLRPYTGKLQAVFHCFAEDAQALRTILDTGGLVSYTGILTFKNGQNVRDVLAVTPPGKFMLETDCPFLAPMPYRGKRCEPAFLQSTATVAAQQLKCSLPDLAEATTAAVRQFFPKIKLPS